MDCCGLSDPGRVRKNNEDSLLIDQEKKLYLVADGMGGAQAGETASRLAVDTVAQYLRDYPKPTLQDLEAAFVQANDQVKKSAAADLTLEGMGTTLVGVLEDTEQLHIASVGDSRLYICENERVHSLTEDQTWVNEVGRRLGIDEDTLKRHPMRHVLTMAIGVGNPLRVFTRSIPNEPGLLLMLCSDGLHGVVPDQQIFEVLSNPLTKLEDKAKILIEAARTNGGPDNITVLLLRS